MPTTGVQTAEFTAMMKTRYRDPINDAVVRSHVLLNRLEQKNDEFEISGTHVVIPLITARNAAVGSRKDSQDGGPKLPAIGRQTYANATFEIVLHYGRGSVSGAVSRKSRDNNGAFARALDIEFKGLMKSMPDNLNQQICGIGNGRAASLAATPDSQGAGTTILCEARDNFQVRIGDRVIFNDISGGAGITPSDGTTVTNIALATGTGLVHTVTLAASSDTSLTTADDAMYFGGGSSASLEDMAYASDMYGIQSLVDDGDIGADETVATELVEVHTGSVTKFGGITRSSTPAWQSKVITNPAGAGTKRTLTETILLEAHLFATSQGGADPSGIELYMDVSMWGTVGLLQVGSRLYNEYQKTTEFGFQYIEVNGSKAFYDRDLPLGKIFLLNMKNLFLLTQGGYEFIDDDGKVLRQIAGGGRDAWEFALRRDLNLAADGLRQHVLVKDLAQTMTVKEQKY